MRVMCLMHVYACVPGPMLRTEDSLQGSLLFYHMGPWDGVQAVRLLLTELSHQPPLGSLYVQFDKFLSKPFNFLKKIFLFILCA